VWSGIDTVNNPGSEKVRQACSMGWASDDCAKTYSSGSSAQLRTNVYVGVTSGLAAVTAVVGLFFTQWSSPAATGRAAPLVAPVVGIGQAGVEGTF